MARWFRFQGDSPTGQGLLTEGALGVIDAELRRYGPAGRVRGDGAGLAEERPEWVLLAVLGVGTLLTHVRRQVQLVAAVALFCWAK